MVIAPVISSTLVDVDDVPDHSAVPGIVIAHSPARTKKYIGCPSIVILSNGDYVASHSFFGPGSTNNRSRVYRSEDRGKTWHLLTDIDGQWWSTLFLHKEQLYLMGTSGRYANCVIRKSSDGGKSWTTPTGNRRGLLLSDSRYACAPVPVVIHKNRIWRAMEDSEVGRRFRAFVMSASVDADLLDADNWTVSNRLQYDKALPGKGWLEGNVVTTPEGNMLDILRHDSPAGGTAAVVQVSEDGRTVSIDPQWRFIEFPGGCKKFTIRYDRVSKQYWSLTNYIPPQHEKGNPERTRNTLALTSSRDLINWQVESILLYHPDVAKTGFQYVDWQFDGKDMVAVSRTAYEDGLGGAHDCHDANYLTFHRIRNFRRRTLNDSPLD